MSLPTSEVRKTKHSSHSLIFLHRTVFTSTVPTPTGVCRSKSDYFKHVILLKNHHFLILDSHFYISIFIFVVIFSLQILLYKQSETYYFIYISCLQECLRVLWTFNLLISRKNELLRLQIHSSCQPASEK
jgi:hypothetical protein